MKMGIAIMLWSASAAVANDPAATSPAATGPEDKRQCTLFNPAPSDQLRDIDTDRPDKTNSPHTIDAGHLQIEFGLFDYLYNRDRYHGANARTDALGLAQFNIRLGVLNNVELNAILNPYQFERNTDNTARQSSRQTTLGDTIIGGKFNFWGDDSADKVWDTAFGIQPQFKIATARDPSGNGHPELVVNVPLAINFPADFVLTVQTASGWERNSTNTGYVASWENSASLDHTIFGKLDGYLEYWSAVTTERHQEAEQTLDFGGLYTLTDSLVLDMGVSLGLNHASPSVEWTAGATVRF